MACVYVGAATMEAWRRYQITGAVVIGWDPSDLGSGNQNLIFWKNKQALIPRAIPPTPRHAS